MRHSGGRNKSTNEIEWKIKKETHINMSMGSNFWFSDQYRSSCRAQMGKSENEQKSNSWQIDNKNLKPL